MNARLRTLAIGVLASAAALAGVNAVAAVARPAPQAPTKTLHPNFALVDASGVNVLASGKAVSTMRSCGQCHDTDFIASHGFHVDLGLSSFASSKQSFHSSPGLFGQWDPLRYRFLTQAGDERLAVVGLELREPAGIDDPGDDLAHVQ